MRRIYPPLPPPELGQWATEIRQLLADLERAVGPEAHTSGECEPPLDVFENDQAMEVRLDVPGVPAEGLRVVCKRGVLLVAGAKARPEGVTPPGATFHVVERAFGRFVRAVRLDAALDVARARAVLGDGELRVIIPKRVDRRGREQHIPIEVLPPGSGSSA